MERIMSVEERIKRAEEIYQRRKNEGVRLTGNTVNISTKPDVSLFKKMFFKIIICIIIYSVFYGIKNSNHIFSQDVLKKTNEILSYDMNIEMYYGKLVEYFNGLNINFNSFSNTKNEVNQEGIDQNIDNKNVEGVTENINSNSNNTENFQESNNQDGNKLNIEENKVERNKIKDSQSINLNNNEESKQNEVGENKQTLNNETVPIGGVGGGSDIFNESVTTQEQKSQMEIDAEYIKNNFEISIPLKGTITSRFGPRTATEIVSANHAGIDIGVCEGTKIVSAMDGKATVVSSVGDYGNHLKVVNGNVTTLYAHCKTIYVKEGDEINKGMEIAEVGETGKATGPHLHFEIRVDDRVVNPEYVLEF